MDISLFDHIIGAKEEKPVEVLKMNESLMISAGTSTTLGSVTQPGKTAKIHLRRPVCAHIGSKVAISRRVGARWHLIGFGIIK